ncbi:sodium:solute symporter [Mucilaginibacter pedocola]|uniref:Sodium:solute symporter n=1 Tax=Mucilaginibacter pedocola TaxID=1792845 RepID=A0A1S9PFR8_9SPHI|nr:sodium:solute symporter [Mucilaginibacter pedocola]OOQ59769.1 sodium:solute symporter [Mucilaginibacter pedocola]
MSNLHLPDIVIIFIYLVGMIGVGFYFSRKNKTASQFTKASGKIPGWALGLSLYATFLSSNTFLGVPGKAFGSNWNAYVFSLSMPLAAWIASKYFVPFYRSQGAVSAYTNLEQRFGTWARTYAVVCFLLTQLARMGSVFFGIAISLQALTQVPMSTIMILMGICIIIYTVMGGIEAVIWTEVVQGVIKTFGAGLILYLIVRDLPGGFRDVISVGTTDHKFSLGTLSLNFTESSFWVVLFYGFFINLNNFGMDQNYVQRYHAAPSEKQARRSVWLCVYIYVPASLLFFFIGTSLYAYYNLHPGMLNDIRQLAAAEKHNAGHVAGSVADIATSLKPNEYGDKVMPDFMVRKIPAGLLGLIISAILSAAMSSISSSMNSSATVFTEDIFKRYIQPNTTGKKDMKVLYIATVAFGLLGMCTGLAMIGAKSVLDIWWELSGIFAGGMLGLFLLGLISKTSRNADAITATLIGTLVILWMTLPSFIPDRFCFLRSPFHKNMIIVIGTLTILLTGSLIAKLRAKSARSV